MQKTNNGGKTSHAKPASSGTRAQILPPKTRTGAGEVIAPLKSKSLMKTSGFAARGNGATQPVRVQAPAVAAKARGAKASAASRKGKIEERVAVASEELASGITEAASAAEELRRAMEQIAAGAEEAASASHEMLGVATATTSTLATARERAETARRRTEALQTMLAEASGQIGAWASNIKRNGERQAASIAIIERLSEQAVNIGEVTQAIGNVSDQTNLLALNAAIEAAHAGDHGRGFAVVADEVRTLAETSEKSARDAQALVARIQEQVRAVSGMIKTAAHGAAAEAEKSQTVNQALEELRKEVAAIAEGSQATAMDALQAEAASRQGQKGAEIISSAAEEQAAAAAEALRSVEQQASALEESQVATRSLAALAANLDVNATTERSAEQLASAAEQMSTSIQEISGAASQIMAALEQISRGGQQQASATQEASAALEQVEKTALAAKRNASAALDGTVRASAMLNETRTTITNLSGGVARALETTRQSLEKVGELERISRAIDKIIDGIAMVSIQTTMLAVNGSVEAARAGEFGRGFAVVSKDIRTLARDSGDNSGRIKETVRSIQDQITQVRRELELAISAAESENQKTAAVTARLASVETEMAEIADGSRDIVAAADAMLASTQEAARGARQVAAAAEQAGSAVAEAAAAAKQQARGSEDLAAAIEEIASLAQSIQTGNG